MFDLDRKKSLENSGDISADGKPMELSPKKERDQESYFVY